MKLALTLILMTVVGCGQADSGASTSTTMKEAQKDAQEAKLVDSDIDLWDCTAEIANQLVYIKDQAVFYTCSAEMTWEVIEIKGDKGDAGDKGEQGEKGDKGDSQIAALYDCPTREFSNNKAGVDQASITVFKNGGLSLQAFFYFTGSSPLGQCSKLTKGDSIACSASRDRPGNPTVTFDVTSETATYTSGPWVINVVCEKIEL